MSSLLIFDVGTEGARGVTSLAYHMTLVATPNRTGVGRRGRKECNSASFGLPDMTKRVSRRVANEPRATPPIAGGPPFDSPPSYSLGTHGLDPRRLRSRGRAVDHANRT